MAIDPRNRVQIRERELRVWDLLLQGLDGVEIARREGVDPAVISRIKARVERRLIAETQDKAAAFLVRQIGELRCARREAWRGWEASWKPAAKTTRRSGAAQSGTVEASEIKGQSGNPVFLEQIYHGIQLEAKITGTEAPKKQSIEGALQLSTLTARIAAARHRLAAAQHPSWMNQP